MGVILRFLYRAGVHVCGFWDHLEGPDGDLEPHLGLFVPNFSTETCTSQARWRILGVSQLDRIRIVLHVVSLDVFEFLMLALFYVLFELI